MSFLNCWARESSSGAEREVSVMKATVDQEACISCGACIDEAPDVFSWDDDEKAKAIEGEIPEDQQAAAREAADACPVEAITIEE
jgi:ferredoxin